MLVSVVCQHGGHVNDLFSPRPVDRTWTRRSRVVCFMLPRLLAAVDGEVNFSTSYLPVLCSCGIAVGLYYCI